MGKLWQKLTKLDQDQEDKKLVLNFPVFKELRSQDLEYLFKAGSVRSYLYNEIIFESEKPAMALHFVLSGSVGLYRQRKNEEMERFKYVKQGECFGEEAVLQDKLRLFTAKATEETKTFAITSSELRIILSNKSRIAICLLYSIICSYQDQLNTSEEELYALTRKLTEANIIV